MDKYLSKDIWYTTHPTPTIILSFYAQKYSGDNHQQIEKWEEKEKLQNNFPLIFTLLSASNNYFDKREIELVLTLEIFGFF